MPIQLVDARLGAAGLAAAAARGGDLVWLRLPGSPAAPRGVRELACPAGVAPARFLAAWLADEPDPRAVVLHTDDAALAAIARVAGAQGSRLLRKEPLRGQG